MFTPAEKDFVQSHLHANVSALALQLGRFRDLNASTVLKQISGFQAIEHKIPSWYAQADLLFPQSLSLEQCSSEATARYKAQIVAGLEGVSSLADLTGGFGVDCAFMAHGLPAVLYVERQEALCAVAGHNFNVLGLSQIEVMQGDGLNILNGFAEASLQNAAFFKKPFDLIFLDPARRDHKGGKVVALSDCEPDLTQIKSVLLASARYVLVKLSPMLDISLALKSLPETISVHVVSVDGECKELLFLLAAENLSNDCSVDSHESVFGVTAVSRPIAISGLIKDSGQATDAGPTTISTLIAVSAPIMQSGSTAVSAPTSHFAPTIHCVNLCSNSSSEIFIFTKSSEQNALCLYAEKPGIYLYEPNASILKAGAFSILTQVFDVRKLHPNSHLYTSDQLCSDFPGRIFQVESFFPFHSKELKIEMGNSQKANITVRNFPNTVAEIRKKTGLKDGGDVYLFATTLKDEKKVLIKCKKVI